MTFNRRDSIGRSDVYNNPYDMRHVSNPAIKKFRAEACQQDTMESQQALLEKNLLRQMEEGYFKLPKGGLLYIVYLGKGLFFVMMIPSYLLLYGIPKWLLMQGGPAAMKAMKKAARRLREQFQESVLAQIQALARKISSRLEKMGRGVKELFNSTVMVVLKNAKDLSDKLKNIASEYLRRIASAYNRNMEPFRKAAALVKKGAEWVQEKVGKLVEGAQAMLNSAVESIQSPFLEMTDVVKEALKKARNSAEKTTKSVSQSLDKNLLSPLRTARNKIAEGLKKISQPIVEVYKRRVLEPYRKVATKIKNITEAVTDYVRERQDRIRDLARDISHKTTDLYNKAIENVSPAVKGILNGMVNIVPQPVINFFVPIALAVGSVWKTRNNLKRNGKRLIERVRNLKEWTKATSKWVIVKVKKGMHQLKKTAKWVVELAKKVPSIAWKFICAAAAISVEAGKRIFFLMRLLSAWVKVLFKYGFIQIRAKLAI